MACPVSMEVPLSSNRENMAHIRQSRPDCGLDFQAEPFKPRVHGGASSSSLSLSSLELSDTRVYARYIRAFLGTAAQFCEEVAHRGARNRGTWHT
jgi:hypothetical protein